MLFRSCDFPAHRQCVLGKYPYIKFGRTYEDKNHQHPITFVRKTESSPPCDACGKTFDGMALECTQCKFNVHGLNSECMQKISTEVHATSITLQGCVDNGCTSKFGC